MLNQGDAVGNKKGLVVMVTQNGALEPIGMAAFGFGMAAFATQRLLFGKASCGCLGAAGRQKH